MADRGRDVQAATGDGETTAEQVQQVILHLRTTKCAISTQADHVSVYCPKIQQLSGSWKIFFLALVWVKVNNSHKLFEKPNILVVIWGNVCMFFF